MFGNLMGDMEEKQAQLREKLAGERVQAEVQDGAIVVVANGIREIQQITIDPELAQAGDAEQLEDLLLVAVNRALELSAQLETEETQKSLKDMLPPGLDSLLG